MHQQVEATASHMQDSHQQLYEAQTSFTSELTVAKDSISVLERQREELTRQVEEHRERVVGKFEEDNQRLSTQEKLLQQNVKIQTALKTQHTNTAARVGHQASIVHELGRRQRDSERKVSMVQEELSTLVQEQATIRSATTTVSGQIEAMEKQLQMTVSDVNTVKTEVKVLQSTSERKLVYLTMPNTHV